MNVHELVATTRDALSARTVFGEPCHPAVLRGGVGGGGDRRSRETAWRVVASA
jgi:hypothetical protein